MLQKGSGEQRVPKEFIMSIDDGETPLFEALTAEYDNSRKENRRTLAAEAVERSRETWHQQLAAEALASAELKASQRTVVAELFGSDKPLSLSVSDDQISKFISSLREEVEQAQRHYMDTADLRSSASPSEVIAAKEAYEAVRERWQSIDTPPVTPAAVSETYRIPRSDAQEMKEATQSTTLVEVSIAEKEQQSTPFTPEEINFNNIQMIDPAIEVDSSTNDSGCISETIENKWVSRTYPGPNASFPDRVKASFCRGFEEVKKTAGKIANRVRGSRVMKKMYQVFSSHSSQMRMHGWFEESGREYAQQRQEYTRR